MAAGLIRDGFTFVACGGDVSLLAKGADALLASVRDGIA
jgi:4-hydroxy-2-oxoheptanedioate aldolase